MDSASVVDVSRLAIRRRTLARSLRGGLKGGEYAWAVAFVVPYIAVFVTFVAYPVVYGLWMGSEASLYRELFADPIYQSTVVNTVFVDTPSGSVSTVSVCHALVVNSPDAELVVYV